MSIDVTVKDIQFKRAATEDKIPILNDGEPAISKDSKSLFIGNGGKNIKISPVEIVNNLEEENTGKSLDASQGKILKDLVNNLESKKVDKVAGKDLSTNDFTTVEKKKLAAIEEGANKYVHPTKHVPVDISTDSLNRFVTDAEKENWSSKETTEGSQSKADAALASAKTYTDSKTANKVEKVEGKDLSSNDYTTTEKAKLAGIDDGANKYVHPATHEASMVTTDATHRFVTDTEKANWSAKESVVSAQEKADKALAAAKTYTDEKVSVKVDKIAGKDLSSNDYTAVEKTKLAGIAEGANKYVHPATHAPADIATDANNRFVSDIEKETWNAKETVEDSQAKADKALEDAKSYTNEKTSTKVDKVAGKELSSNDYTTVEKTKLAGIAEGANKYVHPTTHSPSEIATDTKNRFVSDVEKADWNSKETTTGAQNKADKALSDAKTYADAKVSAIVDSAPETLDTLKELSDALGNDPNFATTISTQIGTKASKTYVDDALETKVDKVTGKSLSSNDYTTTEKSKLAGIEEAANKYIHPATHSPAEIATDTKNRFVSDAEKADWNAKETAAGSQAKSDKALSDSKTYTDAKVSALVDSAPESLNTLKKVAAALGDDPDFATTVSMQLKTKSDKTYVDTGLSSKVDKITGKGLSSNDYTTEEKTKLAGIAVGANKYVHPASHGPSEIATDSNNRFVTDAEKSTWNSKETTTGAQSKATQALTDAKTYTDEKVSIKVDKVAGKGLSTNDYTTAEKTKLAGLSKVEVANTLTEATVGKALDAVQGKVLNDMITKLDKSAALKYRGSQFDEAKKNGIDIEGASFEEIYDFVVNDGYYFAYNAGNIEFALVLNLKDENENDYIFQQIVQGLGNPQDAPEGKISVVYRARRAVQQTGSVDNYGGRRYRKRG